MNVLLFEMYVLWLCTILWRSQSNPQWLHPQPNPAKSPIPRPTPNTIPGPGTNSPGYQYHPGQATSGAPYTTQGSYCGTYMTSGFAGSMTICDPCSTTFCSRSEEHTSELQSHHDLVCRLLLEKK